MGQGAVKGIGIAGWILIGLGVLAGVMMFGSGWLDGAVVFWHDACGFGLTLVACSVILKRWERPRLLKGVKITGLALIAAGIVIGGGFYLAGMGAAAVYVWQDSLVVGVELLLCASIMRRWRE